MFTLFEGVGKILETVTDIGCGIPYLDDEDGLRDEMQESEREVALMLRQERAAKAGKLGSDTDRGADVGEAAAGLGAGAHGFIDAQAGEMDADREDGSVALQSAPIRMAAYPGNAFARAFWLSVAQDPFAPEAGVRKSAASGRA